MKKTFSLQELAEALGGELSDGKHAALEAGSLTCSSNEIEPGGLFVAIKGEKSDGHRFIEDAASRGAVAFVGTERGASSLPSIIVSDSRVALSRLANLFFDSPSSRLKLVGVTGTNGKTTLCSLIYDLLLSLGSTPVRLGTLGVRAEGLFDEPGNLTTPDPITLNRYLSLALSSGVDSGAMEVSSHGLSQHRVDDIEFRVGVYTNLTRDHLDYHSDMESYYQAKFRLFALMAERSTGGTAVINLDCSYGKRIVKDLSCSGLKIVTYGSAVEADVCITSFSQSVKGSSFAMNVSGVEHRVSVPFIGFHNALNISAACAAMMALGYDLDKVVSRLQVLPQVPGRLQAVEGRGFSVFVDYAHTPDALKNVLSTLKPLVQGKLWLVFGCGGDRDKGKRGEMGEVASAYADEIVVTSDNPRTEDPSTIVDAVAAGVNGRCYKEVDRRLAIVQAVTSAGPEDIVLIAGKGHEDYQIIGTLKKHFSDVEEVEKALEQMDGKDR